MVCLSTEAQSGSYFLDEFCQSDAAPKCYLIERVGRGRINSNELIRTKFSGKLSQFKNAVAPCPTWVKSMVAKANKFHSTNCAK